jgi:hypothetical protein
MMLPTLRKAVNQLQKTTGRLLYGHMTTLFSSSAYTLTLRVFHRNKFAEKAVYSSPDFLNRYRKSEVLDFSKQI